MKKLLLVPALLGVVLISACGPSAAEIEAKNKKIADSIASVEAEHQKMIEDSIKTATAAAEAKAAEEAKAKATADSLAAAEAAATKGKKK